MIRATHRMPRMAPPISSRALGIGIRLRCQIERTANQPPASTPMNSTR